MLFRISEDDAVVEVGATTTVSEDVYEQRLESWVACRPEMLGEPLLIIGRQVELDGGKDRIDLLAIGQDGTLVVIELKRDLIGGSTDLQALRYAALVSNWTEAEIRRQAEGYWESAHEERDFSEEIEALCGEQAELNSSQAVILVGRDPKPRLGTMALWLIGQGVQIKVVAIGLLKDDDRLYAQPQVVIPPPSEKSLQTKVSIGASKKPWLVDGQTWHLEGRCGPVGREIVERLLALIAEAVPDAEGPNWSQKLYITWRFGGKSWLYLVTGAKRAALHINKSPVSAEQAAERLGYVLFDDEAELADKFALGSSVGVNRDWLRLTVKDSADIDNDKADAMKALLIESWTAFTGQPATAQTISGNGSAATPVP